MVLADLIDDGTRISVVTEYRHKELIKAVPGATWNRDTGHWEVPLSWASCIALRGTFQSELELGPGLDAWARDYVTTVVNPAMSLRDALTASGDPDLFEHQKADVQFLATTQRAILASEMGTGKTKSTIRALVELHRRGENVFPALVVCPNSVKENWAREITAAWPGTTAQVISGTAVQRRKKLAGPAHFYIINFESLKSHSRLAPYGSIALRRCTECGGEDPKITVTKCDVHDRELNHMSFQTVIADEAHRIKDPTTRQTRALKWVGKQATFRYALTGTPIANNVVDLWSILNFIDPVEWPSKTRWIDRLVDIVYNLFGGIVVSSIKSERQDEFNKTVYPRMRRMTKEVVLPFLPPIVRERRDVAMTPKQKKAYEQMADHMMAMLDDGDLLVTTNPMIQAMRLLQLASSYGELEVVETVAEDGSIETHDKLVLSDPSSKIDAFMDDLGDFEGRRVIVFAVSRQLIMLLSKHLESKKIDHGLIVGNQHVLDRQEAIDDFQAGRTKIILATVQAGGTGINLTAADTVVYLQRSWSLIDMDQSMARAHRIGSEVHESILRVDYVAPDTFEEVVIARLEGKSAGLEEIVRDKELLKKAIRGEAAVPERGVYGEV